MGDHKTTNITDIFDTLLGIHTSKVENTRTGEVGRGAGWTQDEADRNAFSHLKGADPSDRNYEGGSSSKSEESGGGWSWFSGGSSKSNDSGNSESSGSSYSGSSGGGGSYGGGGGGGGGSGSGVEGFGGLLGCLGVIVLGGILIYSGIFGGKISNKTKAPKASSVNSSIDNSENGKYNKNGLDETIRKLEDEIRRLEPETEQKRDERIFQRDYSQIAPQRQYSESSQPYVPDTSSTETSEPSDSRKSQIYKKYSEIYSRAISKQNKYKSKVQIEQQVKENMENELRRQIPLQERVVEDPAEKEQRELREYREALRDDVKMARRSGNKELEEYYRRSFDNTRTNNFSGNSREKSLTESKEGVTIIGDPRTYDEIHNNDSDSNGSFRPRHPPRR